MRYAIFTDIHANLEALEAVLAKIDELAQQEPIDQIWFLGDLVGYGPNPNECIDKLRERTEVIIAGNHDWAAVGKIDLEDFSEAARISALWTAEQLTEEHRTFLANLPESIEIGESLLVHGSPYGPLWEYLTSEVLAERSFQQFSTRFCFVGHTHVPVIFQQPDTVTNTPTRPLDLHDVNSASNQYNDEQPEIEFNSSTRADDEDNHNADLTPMHTSAQTAQAANTDSAYREPETLQDIVADAVDAVTEIQQQLADDAPNTFINLQVTTQEIMVEDELEQETTIENELETVDNPVKEEPTEEAPLETPASAEIDAEIITTEDETEAETTDDDDETEIIEVTEEITPEDTIQNAEERLNQEIEELLALLGLSQSMIHVTNEMISPPEGEWQAPTGYRAIINPGGVGQPRDGDARAAFMIYDTKKGFTFYRVEYPFEKTQEKIIQVNLPQYLATRLAYGR